MKIKAMFFTIAFALFSGGLVAQPKKEAPDPCAQSKSMHQEMVKQTKANDAKLDDLVKKLHAAKGADRSKHMEAIVLEIVAQIKASRQMMNKMHGHMMKNRMGMMDADCPKQDEPAHDHEHQAK